VIYTSLNMINYQIYIFMHYKILAIIRHYWRCWAQIEVLFVYALMHYFATANILTKLLIVSGLDGFEFNASDWWCIRSRVRVPGLTMSFSLLLCVVAVCVVVLNAANFRPTTLQLINVSKIKKFTWFFFIFFRNRYILYYNLFFAM